MWREAQPRQAAVFLFRCSASCHVKREEICLQVRWGKAGQENERGKARARGKVSCHAKTQPVCKCFLHRQQVLRAVLWPCHKMGGTHKFFSKKEGMREKASNAAAVACTRAHEAEMRERWCAAMCGGCCCHARAPRQGTCVCV